MLSVSAYSRPMKDGLDVEYPETIAYPNHQPHYCQECGRWCDYLGQHGVLCRLAADRFYKEQNRLADSLAIAADYFYGKD